MSEVSAAALQSEPFLLLPHTVTDLDAIQADPDAYFVSMYADPQRAATLWRERLKANPAGCDGYLRLTYQGQVLIGPRLWGEVSSIWYSLVGVAASYLETGEGKDYFPDQPVPMRLYRSGRSTLFQADEDRWRVDPDEFVPGLLREAEKYFTWVQDRIGDDEHWVLGEIDRLGG